MTALELASRRERRRLVRARIGRLHARLSERRFPCPYCGARTPNFTCRAHADLPALDPFYGGGL